MAGGPAVAALVAAASIWIALGFGLHTIDNGHIGVYYRGGALLDETSGQRKELDLLSY